jgi:hypothetical protein
MWRPSGAHAIGHAGKGDTALAAVEPGDVEPGVAETVTLPSH